MVKIKCVGADGEDKKIHVEGGIWEVGDVREVEDEKAERLLAHVAFEKTDEDVPKSKKKEVG